MLQPEPAFTKTIGSLICSKPANDFHLKVKAKVLTANAPYVSPPSLSFLISYHSFPCSLHPNHPCFLDAFLNMSRPLYLGICFCTCFYLCLQCSSFSYPLSSLPQQSGLYSNVTVLDAFSWLLIEKGKPPRNSPSLYPASYSLCISYHHLMCYRFICLFVNFLPPLEETPQTQRLCLVHNQIPKSCNMPGKW